MVSKAVSCSFHPIDMADGCHKLLFSDMGKLTWIPGITNLTWIPGITIGNACQLNYGSRLLLKISADLYQNEC